MAVVFLLAGWPVYRLTRPAAVMPVTDAANPAVDGAAQKATPLALEVVCTSAPADFQITYLGQSLLTGQAPRARFSRVSSVAVPPEGADLVVEARWPTAAVGNASAADTASGANPAAARVTARLADGRQIEKSFWADANGAMNEVFTIPAGAATAAP